MSRQEIRVLIVEDCPECREQCTRFLKGDRQQKYVVLEADTARLGYELILREHPHLVLLSHCPPVLDGLRILANMNGRPIGPGRPAVILLASQGSEELAATALRSGAADYLPKAMLTEESLLCSVRRVIAQVRKSRRKSQHDKHLRRVLHDTNEKLAAAGEVQRLLLPTASPQVPGVDIGGTCLPAEATGGDFFDFIMKGDGSLAVVMGDVVGHGLGPALFAAETRAYLRAFSQTLSAPGAILAATNRLLCQDTRGERFVTLFFGNLDPGTRLLQFSGAGHRAYLIHAVGNVTKIDSNQPPLGLGPEFIPGIEGELSLQSGDLLLLMTDGITECARRKGKTALPDRMFGETRALEFVRTNRSQPAADLVSGLLQEVNRFTGQVSHDDDMTVVIVKADKAAR